MSDKRKTERIIWLVTIGLLVIFFVVSIVQLIFLFGIKRKQNQLEKELESNRTYIEEKQREIDYLMSDEYLQDWADQNGYVKS